jgi:hypothetical protein
MTPQELFEYIVLCVRRRREFLGINRPKDKLFVLCSPLTFEKIRDLWKCPPIDGMHNVEFVKDSQTQDRPGETFRLAYEVSPADDGMPQEIGKCPLCSRPLSARSEQRGGGYECDCCGELRQALGERLVSEIVVKSLVKANISAGTAHVVWDPKASRVLGELMLALLQRKGIPDATA